MFFHIGRWSKMRAVLLTTGWAYHFVQVTDLHMEPFYNPENGHAHGNVCRVPEAFNKSQCMPFKVEPDAETYPFGRLNCDPPAATLRSLFGHVAEISEEKKPSFAVFTGDIPGHQLSCQHHQARTIEYVVNLLKDRLLPVVGTVYPAMGNNDYFPNYNCSLEPNSPWQEYVASIYARNNILHEPQLSTFRRGGYYSATPHKGLRLIMLNTVVWSEKLLDWTNSPKTSVAHPVEVADAKTYAGPDAPTPGADVSSWTWSQDVPESKVFIPCKDRPRDPYGQIAWATAELEAAKKAGERVLLAGHVPPGNKVGDNNFCQQHADDLAGLSETYADIIEVEIFGDHSNDEFRMIWSKEEPVHAVASVLVSAGVTPRKHCNPSWRMFDVTEEEHDVRDFTQYYLPLIDATLRWEDAKKSGRPVPSKDVAVWAKQYSWREEYGVDLEPAGLERLWEQMQHDPAVMEKYLRHMFSQTVGVEDYFDYVCDMRYLDAESNQQCQQTGRLLPADRALLAEGSKAVLDFSVMPSATKGVEVHPTLFYGLVGAVFALSGISVSLAYKLTLTYRQSDYVACP